MENIPLSATGFKYDPDNVPDDLVTVEDAEAIGVASRSTIRRRVLSGRLPGYEVEGNLQVSLSQVREYFKPRQYNPAEAAFEDVTKSIAAALPFLNMRQRQLLAGHLTGDFSDPDVTSDAVGE